MRKRSNVCRSARQWTTDAIAREFGLDKTSVWRAMKDVPRDANGFWSTRSVVAVLGEMIFRRHVLILVEETAKRLAEEKQ